MRDVDVSYFDYIVIELSQTEALEIVGECLQQVVPDDAILLV